MLCFFRCNKFHLKKFDAPLPSAGQGPPAKLWGEKQVRHCSCQIFSSARVSSAISHSTLHWAVVKLHTEKCIKNDIQIFHVVIISIIIIKNAGPLRSLKVVTFVNGLNSCFIKQHDRE